MKSLKTVSGIENVEVLLETVLFLLWTKNVSKILFHPSPLFSVLQRLVNKTSTVGNIRKYSK